MSSRLRTTLVLAIALVAALLLSACNADTEPASEITATSAVLHADGDGEAGERVSYWFEYRKQGASAWQRTDPQQRGPFGNSFTNVDVSERVTGLTPLTTYEFRLCGILQQPYPAGTMQNPICFDDVKGSTNRISTFTTLAGPSSNPSVVPGTGAILGEDLGAIANPSDVWGAQDSPASEGYESNGQTDPYILRRTASADPHLAVGQSQPSAYYRRVIADGKVSLGDLTRNPNHTRTQLQHMWFERGIDHNQFDFAPGDTYVFYFSYRSEPGVHPEAVETRGGNNTHTQLFQFKNFGEGQGNSQSPPFAGYLGNNGIGFKTSDINENKTWQFLHAPAGQWVRIAMVVNWDTNGWYEVWSDLQDQNSGILDPSGALRKVVPRQTGVNFMQSGMTRSALGIGLYHKLSLFDGTINGHPKQAEVWTDYANAQMTRYTGS